MYISLPIVSVGSDHQGENALFNQLTFRKKEKEGYEREGATMSE